MGDFLSWLAAALAAVVPGFGPDGPPVYNGYVEADYIYVAPSGPGRITSIAVEEGDRAFEGQQLFTLDDSDQEAALRAARAQVDVAKANLDNLKTGSRTAELRVISASLEQAKANQELARTTLARSVELRKRDLVPPAQVDADRAALETANAKVAQLQAQLDVAELPARDAQLVGAQASLDAAKAEAERAQAALDDRVVLSPATGLIEKVFFDVGEVAGAGAPTIAILQPDKLKVIFFVPEPERAGFALGDRLSVACDGCPDGVTATVTRMASDPQYTPPVIYSREERTRLVYRAEARLGSPEGLLPGQPVTLRRLP